MPRCVWENVVSEIVSPLEPTRDPGSFMSAEQTLPLQQSNSATSSALPLAKCTLGGLSQRWLPIPTTVLLAQQLRSLYQCKIEAAGQP